MPRCGGGLYHSLAQVTPEEAGAGDGDVLSEDVQAVAMGTIPDTLGLAL